ncbi:MAG: hypothetical protein IJZ87_10240 [Bacteroidales bacterium]|nr:hypothetical protein [Bacteroidales bacterium]
MKAWSKYIIFIITIFAIIICKGESVVAQNNLPDLIEQLNENTENLSTDDPYSSNPQHIYYINSHRTQKNSYRRDNGQKQHLSFIKTNKTTNINASAQTINNFIFKHSTQHEPAHRLIILRKLVI